MSQREFKHTPEPWTIQEEDLGDEHVVILPYHLLGSDKVRIIDGDGGLATGYWEGIPVEKVKANARLLTAAPDLCALLAEIEAAILSLLPDIDPVIGVRKRVKELLDGIEKGDA
jgi:hypothetical protein